MEKDIKTVVIPLDIMLDIVLILLQAGIKHSIEGIKRTRNAVIMDLEAEKGQEAAIENIIELIKDYNFYRYNENEE